MENLEALDFELSVTDLRLISGLATLAEPLPPGDGFAHPYEKLPISSKATRELRGSVQFSVSKIHVKGMGTQSDTELGGVWYEEIAYCDCAAFRKLRLFRSVMGWVGVLGRAKHAVGMPREMATWPIRRKPDQATGRAPSAMTCSLRAMPFVAGVAVPSPPWKLWGSGCPESYVELQLGPGGWFDRDWHGRDALISGSPKRAAEASGLNCASQKNAMVLRCLVVDCGGVTHPDSGLKEAVKKRATGEDAGKKAKAQWSAMRDDPKATKEEFWKKTSSACGLDAAAAEEADAEICATLRGSFWCCS
eukprot:symbB.v1.2.036396.t1/scaffold5128.1/size30560/2